MSIQEEMDRAGYELMVQNNPKVIEEIRTALAQGATAKEIEAQLLRRFGQANLTAALAICAAYYIEKNPQEQAA